MSQINKKGKGCFGCLPCLGAALLVAGGAYFYFQVVAGKRLTPVEGAKVVPESAMMTAFISTEAKSWQKLQQFGSSDTQKLVGEGIEDWSDEILAAAELDYEQDLQPWVGNAMMAWLPSESESWGSNEDNLLLVVGIKNKLKARNFAKQLKAKEGQEIKETKYKGITVSQVQVDGSESLAYAIVDNNNKLVLSSATETVKLAIDTFKGEPSFVGKQEGKEVLTQKLGLSHPIFTFHVAEYGELIQQILTSTSKVELPPETLEQLALVESVVVGLGFEDKGLRLKFLANLSESGLKKGYKPEKGKIVSQFPESTIALMSGSKINESWSEVVAQSEVIPGLQQLLNNWQIALDPINLDLDEDVFGWMDGEIGFGLVTVNEGIFKDFGMGGAAIFQTSDRRTATNTLEKLEELAADISWLSVDYRNIKGKTIVEWLTWDNKVLLSYGWTDDQTLTIALGTPFKELMDVKGKTSLRASKNFKDIAGSLPEKNFGYFYLDMEKAMTTLDNLPSAPNSSIPTETKVILDSIQGIAATSTMSDQSTAELDLLLQLKPSN